MRYIEALEEYTPSQGELSLFLAGGISECNDWQRFVPSRFSYSNLVLLNPRRANFPIDDPLASEEQIIWEHKHLRLATAIMFWFPCETLCPITLFEYGKWLGSHDLTTQGKSIVSLRKQLFVGCHPDYGRKNDLIIQTELERPGLKVHQCLTAVFEEVDNWYAKANPN